MEFISKILFPLILFLILPVLLFFKRKKQIGKTWGCLVLKKIEINHIPLLCRHCNSEKFYKREALITTTFMTLFKWPFFNQSGSAYECFNCGYIAWFSRPKETLIELPHPTYETQTLKVITPKPSEQPTDSQT